jgi:pyruvate dehydrogenase E2 component (dihydrolipoamide acetyltransferase)
MRKIIADRLLESKTQIPHFYLHVEANAAPLMKLRAEVNASAEEGANKISINDFVLRAVALAIAKTPRVNASFAGDAIVEFGSVHLAVAVAIDDGLVTPVIRDAQLKSLSQISLQVKDFAVRARSKKLKPEEFQGGTFTVSNLGSYGIDRFDAIINPPQAAILSVGNIVKKPVIDSSGAIVAGQRIDLGLSCDHRVVDGALGAQFLAALRELLEQPLRLLL